MNISILPTSLSIMDTRTTARAILFTALLVCAALLPVHGKDGPPDTSKPCLFTDSPERLGYMTATNRCPNDTFTIAYVETEPNDPRGPRMFAKGAGGGIAEGAQHEWGGPILRFSKSNDVPDQRLHLAVKRNADGKFVAPKGVNADGSLKDVTNTRKRVCQLFYKGTMGFAYFRATLTPDGSRVVFNDFAFSRRSPPGFPGTPCTEYFEDAHDGRPPVEGRMVDVYAPGSCHFVIDDCRK